MKVLLGIVLLVAFQIAIWAGLIWLGATIVKGVFAS
jgi:hypothetical protein